jgi:hypothetical protein
MDEAVNGLPGSNNSGQGDYCDDEQSCHVLRPAVPERIAAGCCPAMLCPPDIWVGSFQLLSQPVIFSISGSWAALTLHRPAARPQHRQQRQLSS